MMRAFAVIALFILAITCKLTDGTSCSEQRMRDCEEKALHFFKSVNVTEYDEFCEYLKNDSDCSLYLSEDCRKQYQSASFLYTKFFSEMNRWCNGNSAHRKVWFMLGFCMSKHPREIGQCYYLPIKEKQSGNPIQPGCENYKFLNCMHDQVIKYCGENQEFLVNYIKRGIQAFPEYCNGCGGITNNQWFLYLLIFFSLVLSHKIWN